MVREIKAAGGKAVVNRDDIANVAGGENLVNQAIKEFGKLDILVNVAGILRDRMIFNMSEQEWDDVIRVHLKGHYCTMRPASAHMRERKYGRIINFSSQSALGSPGQPNYAAAKAGILGLTYSCGQRAGQVQHYVQRDHARRGDSDDRHDSSRADAGGPGLPASETAEGTPRDPANIAPIVVFLASDEAAYVNGQVFGAAGYRITRYSHIVPERVLMSDSAVGDRQAVRGVQEHARRRPDSAADVTAARPRGHLLFPLPPGEGEGEGVSTTRARMDHFAARPGLC